MTDIKAPNQAKSEDLPDSSTHKINVSHNSIVVQSGLADSANDTTGGTGVPTFEEATTGACFDNPGNPARGATGEGARLVRTSA